MWTNSQRAFNIFKTFAVFSVFGMFMLINGCGSDHDSDSPSLETTSTKVSAAAAPVNSATGTVTTTTTVTAASPTGNIAIAIPSNTTITGKDASGNTVAFTAPPVINVSIPTSSDVSDIPAPKPGFYVSQIAGFVQITFGGLSHVTFSQPVTISIPITDPSKLTNRFAYVNNNDGLGYVFIGPATINAAQTIATVQIDHLSDIALDQVTKAISGSTGGN